MFVTSNNAFQWTHANLEHDKTYPYAMILTRFPRILSTTSICIPGMTYMERQSYGMTAGNRSPVALTRLRVRYPRVIALESTRTRTRESNYEYSYEYRY
eukprot:scaffold159439_cov21-Prasinocladus_malaysianus.AAC.1